MRPRGISLNAQRPIHLPRGSRAVVLLLLSGVIATGLSTVASAAENASIERQTNDGSISAAISKASRRFGVPEHWLRAIIHVESRGVVRATSGKGAMGVMQIMPKTWADLRMRYGFGPDPYDVSENILAGAAYVRELHDRYGSPGFLAAYNAGPGRYEEFLSTGRSLPAETQNYVAALAPVIGAGGGNWFASAVRNVVSWTQAPLFAGHIESRSASNLTTTDRQRNRHRDGGFAVDLSAIVPQSDGLFVQRIRPEGFQ